MYEKRNKAKKASRKKRFAFYVLEIIIIQEHWKRKGKDYAERKDSDTCRDGKHCGL